MSTISCFILALSETSFTKGVDSDFSLDEGENEGDNTAVLLANARKSVNLPDNSSKRAAASKSSTENAKKRRGESRQISTVVSREKESSRPTMPMSGSARKAVNFLNSDKWGQDVRPPHLVDDDVFNTLSVEAASQQIMSWMTTKAMMASNDIKENKARHRGGKEKPDEDIKKIQIEEGEDDAMSTLHKKRFSFRTPLLEPKEYWHLVPLRWKEINKSMHLENIGMDNICSPRTLELLHDRSSPLEIKMFLTLNISVGRAGVSKKQNLRTLDDGTTEVVSSDDWLSPTNISQLIEALDNLVAVWVVMWPGEWSMVALRRTVTKHLAFGDIQNVELRKKMLEAFINEVLASNASLAARGKPPMEFEKLDKLAARYMDNKKHFEKSFKVEVQDQKNEREKSQPNPASLVRKEVADMRRQVAGAKTPAGKEVCFWYNSSAGCKVKHCRHGHACAVMKDGKLCGGSHKKGDHRN